jgi:hypothetical protein
MITSSVLDTLYMTVTTFPLNRALLLREYRSQAYGVGACYAACSGYHVLANAFYAVSGGPSPQFLSS